MTRKNFELFLCHRLRNKNLTAPFKNCAGSVIIKLFCRGVLQIFVIINFKEMPMLPGKFLKVKAVWLLHVLTGMRKMLPIRRQRRHMRAVRQNLNTSVVYFINC
ncbi:hypothetical protein [Chitinophaga jiangningensis]|uniref:hypothetical protein n=1 Tax=Chitinophaga jiangningensis TaxID=1419482 RepID=UPI001160864B|nr:hypothetical protein [Chitinophaga jiangningensis]